MRSLIKYIDEALFSSASEFNKADDINELEFVDLGLSVNWAKCNLGAEEETDYGHYYMWGSTVPNDNDICWWKTAPFNNGSSKFDEDYFDSVKNKVCPNGILAPEYDAAYQESNGDYRMPTKKEFDELINKTDHELVKNYKGTKVNGMKFINKHDSSKFIFIPAAGGRWYSSTEYGNYTCAWSASINTRNGRYACNIDFNISASELLGANITSRDGGFSIRPVKNI